MSNELFGLKQKNISPASLLRKGRTDYIINARWRLRLKHAEGLSLRYDANLLLCRLLSFFISAGLCLLL